MSSNMNELPVSLYPFVVWLRMLQSREEASRMFRRSHEPEEASEVAAMLITNMQHTASRPKHRIGRLW